MQTVYLLHLKKNQQASQSKAYLADSWNIFPFLFCLCWKCIAEKQFVWYTDRVVNFLIDTQGTSAAAYVWPGGPLLQVRRRSGILGTRTLLRKAMASVRSEGRLLFILATTK